MQLLYKIMKILIGDVGKILQVDMIKILEIKSHNLFESTTFGINKP